jgi:hypothetical protein
MQFYLCFIHDCYILNIFLQCVNEKGLAETPPFYDRLRIIHGDGINGVERPGGINILGGMNNDLPERI